MARVRLSVAGMVLALGAPLAHAQELSVTPFRQNGIYELGERAGWTVTRPAGAGVATVKYSYFIKKNNLDQIPGPKEMVSMVESDHNNRTPEKQGAYNARAQEVLGIILGGGEFKPREGGR